MRRKISERLIDRLRSLRKGLEGCRAIRIRTGYWQRSQGAWLWCVETSCGREVGLGSTNTMMQCLRADALEFSSGPFGTEVYAVESSKKKS